MKILAKNGENHEKKHYVGFQIPYTILDKIDESAKATGLSRAEAIRHILLNHFEKEARK